MPERKPVFVPIVGRVPPSLHRRVVAVAATMAIPVENYVAAALVDAVAPEGELMEDPGDFE